jgi:hypothetical protein
MAPTSAELHDRASELEDERDDLQAQLTRLDEELSRALFDGTDATNTRRKVAKVQARIDDIDAALRGSARRVAEAEAKEAAQRRREVIRSYNQVISELPALAAQFLEGVDKAGEAALRMSGIEDVARDLYGELVTEGLTPPIKSAHTLPVRIIGRLAPEIATIANNALGGRVRGDSAARNHGARAAAALERMVNEVQPIPEDWAPELPGDSE